MDNIRQDQLMAITGAMEGLKTKKDEKSVSEKMQKLTRKIGAALSTYLKSWSYLKQHHIDTVLREFAPMFNGLLLSDGNNYEMFQAKFTFYIDNVLIPRIVEEPRYIETFAKEIYKLLASLLPVIIREAFSPQITVDDMLEVVADVLFRTPDTKPIPQKPDDRNVYGPGSEPTTTPAAEEEHKVDPAEGSNE